MTEENQKNLTEPLLAEELFTVEEVAAALGKHPQTIRGWVNQGKADCYRLPSREYRFTREQFKKMLQHPPEGQV